MRREQFLTLSISLELLWYQSQKDIPRKEYYEGIFFINIDEKIFCKTPANWIQEHIKSFIHHDLVRFIPGMQGSFNIIKIMWYTTLIEQIKQTPWSISGHTHSLFFYLDDYFHSESSLSSSQPLHSECTRTLLISWQSHPFSWL